MNDSQKQSQKSLYYINCVTQHRTQTVSYTNKRQISFALLCFTKAWGECHTVHAIC